MKSKIGSILLFGGVVALFLFGAAFLLHDKQSSAEDVSSRTKEKSTKMVQAPVPIWEKVIKLLIRI